MGCEGQEYPVFNSEAVVSGSLLPLLSLQVSMETAAGRSILRSLAPAPTDPTRGQEQPLLSGEQEMCCLPSSSFPLPSSFLIFFFFSLVC